jgi:hypothetical protein
MLLLPIEISISTYICFENQNIKMIKKATKKDISALNLLVNSAFRGETSKKGWTTEEHLLGGIRTAL